jgi:hypothetical protein
MYAIGIEKRHLKELYHHNEVNEAVYRRLTGKLQLQLEAVEHGDLAPNMSLHTDGKDVFEHMATWIRNIVNPPTATDKIQNLFMYYRAQVILSRKVLKELMAIDQSYAKDIFTSDAFTHTVSLYTTFKDQSQKKMDQVTTTNKAIIEPLSDVLATRGVHKVEENVLEELYERELITPKLFIALKEEFEERH